MKIGLFFLIYFSALTLAQSYEILFDVQTASGWYGGDDRPGNQRNVADAQSVTIDEPINLESYAVHFTSGFDFAQNPTGSGHEVTLRLRVRDSLGVVLYTQDLVLPETFSGGWATWETINYNLNLPGKYIFSHHLVGGYDSLQVYSGISCDFNSGYSGGERYSKYVVNDSDAVFWGDWSGHPWDSNFHLKGTLLTTDIKEDNFLPAEFILEQNYPNPFNPSTKINWQSPVGSHQTIKVFDVLGNEIATLVDEYRPAGSYTVNFDASAQSSGVYFYRLTTGSFSEIRKMLLLK